MIHIVIGTRAQLVKMGPVLRMLESDGTRYNLIFTGQHRATFEDIQGNFFSQTPDCVLYEGRDITSIPAMFAWSLRILWQAMTGKSNLFQGDRDGIVLVHGDTFSCLLGALVAKVKGLKVAHVESGLRSHNIFHPFPEELTRILTFCLADVYFCPGQWAVDNLKRFRGEKVNTENNTLLDALTHAVENFERVEVTVPDYPYCVVSTHRFENVFRKPRLLRIVEMVESIAAKMPVVMVMHPVTEKKLKKFGLYTRLEKNPAIEIRPRTDYFKFIKLVYHSEFLVTDGGSNQEEAFYMGKPCLLLRKATERNEGLGGNVVLSEYNPEVVASFLADFSERATGILREEISPSRVICDYIKPFE